MRNGRHKGRMRSPLFDVSRRAGNTPESAWDAVARLVGDRRRGEVIESDPLAHQTLRLLGGKAAYDAVASTPERIRPRFIRVYGVLSGIADLMGELEELIGANEPVAAHGEADTTP